MKKIWIILSLGTLMVHASLLDFMTLKKAQTAYHDSNYTQAIKGYKEVKNKNDEARYNLANAYYKAKKYKEAKAIYESLKSPSLAHQKWHNIGNCEANLGNIDAGIKAYEKAIKLKQDKETKYNLELLKKEKDKKKKNKKKEDKKQQNENTKDSKDKKKSDKKENKDKKSQDKKGKGNKDKKQNKPEKPQSSKNDKKKEQEKAKQMKQEESKQKDQKEKAQAMKAFQKEPISDKEVRKYLKMLDKRGVNTLLVPLNSKGAKDEETTPW